MLFEQKLEKKGKTEIFYRKFGICGFLYWVFIVFEVYSLALYGLFTKGIIHENKEGIYFSLYMGICVGTFWWFFHHLRKKNTDYKTLQMILQPFVLIVTIWGYVIDIFGSYKNCAIFWAALILTISFFINLINYTKEQEKKEIKLGSVVTNNGFSDWASTDVDASIKSMWFRFSRRESDFCIENSFDGVSYNQKRICHMFNASTIIPFGIYACSAEDSSLRQYLRLWNLLIANGLLMMDKNLIWKSKYVTC